VEALRDEARAALSRRRAATVDADRDLLSALTAARDPETGRGFTDEELVDNILTFVLAGHETTALLLTWALHLIANAPDVQRRLFEEARDASGGAPFTAGALERLVFHEQVLNETLRLYPPAPVVARQAVRDVELGPVQVKAGEVVTCFFYVLHRSELLWDQPAAFDPDRFAPERSEGRHRFSFIPFGGGPRVCIGARFAMNEAKTLLATFMRSFEVSPASNAPPLPKVRITLQPENGVILRLTPRGRA
jgi:cytochrome P450